MTKKFVKNLVGKKLSTIVEKYHYDMCQFLDDDNIEMTLDDYEKLKNHKIDKVEFLINDFNYDYIIYVDKFSQYCIFD